MKNKSHDYYTPSEISKMQIDKELAEAYGDRFAVAPSALDKLRKKEQKAA